MATFSTRLQELKRPRNCCRRCGKEGAGCASAPIRVSMNTVSRNPNCHPDPDGGFYGVTLDYLAGRSDQGAGGEPREARWRLVRLLLFRCTFHTFHRFCTFTFILPKAVPIWLRSS